MKSEQFTELQRKNLETGMKLAQLSLDNSQRIIALQVDVAKQLFQDSIDNAKALADVKDPQQAMALQTKYAQDTARKMMDAAREIADIGNTSRTELGQMVTEQLASGSKDMMSAFQSFFVPFPGQSTDVMDAMKQAMTKATGAMEQFVQASSSFGLAAPAAKTTKKKSA